MQSESEISSLLKSPEQKWREENLIPQFLRLLKTSLIEFEESPTPETIRALKYYVDQINNRYIGRKNVKD